MTPTAAATRLLRELSSDRFWTAATLANRAGIATQTAKDLLDEFEADALVVAKPHDCFRLTYKLA